MMKQILHAAAFTLLVVSLTACSTPEEKAADYVESADELLEEGNLKKAAIE